MLVIERNQKMTFNLNEKKHRLNFDYLREADSDLNFEVVKINRSKTANNTPTLKVFCTVVGGDCDKKTVIKEIYNTENNIPAIRRFAIACGKSEKRIDSDGDEYDHVLISDINQLIGSFFIGDFEKNKNDYLELQNERVIPFNE